ncbi:lymphocyte antigen 75-like [Asterias rubens]|uniref:lymphocyte antigen 75-like n=1 Tax=Asterias rubens TaxID=7604 RepID=UPI001455B66F|nr:lymphocyte antigen 75-like [Asterias rubens]
MSQCRKDWSQYGNQCFYVNTNALSYRDAKAHCQSFGGGANIASISDSGTNSHVSSLLVSSDRYYIGYQDADSEGTFTWDDGASVTYINWRSSEPTGGYNRNCVGLYSGGWDNFGCSHIFKSVCRAIIQYTATTTGCPCYWDSTRNDCACCYTGGCNCGADYPDRCVVCGGDCTTTEAEPLEDWTLVFKHARSSGINLVDLWSGSGTYNDGSASAQIVTSTADHYKSSAANNYDTNSIEYVKFAFYTSGGSEVMSMTFNAANTDKTSWFSSGQLLYAPYTDIYTASKNYFSLAGDTGLQRAFFINSYYGGCSIDAGWACVKDTGSSTACSWDGYYTKPFFVYSTASTYTSYQSGSRSFPEIMAIFYKYYDTSTNQGICDDSWDLGNSARSCYRVVESAVSWPDALDACRSLRSDADLVSVASADEHASVLAVSRRTFIGAEYWIGFSDNNEEGTWEWSDNTYSTYTAWNPGEPNNANSKEHCGVMMYSEEGLWYDLDCGSSKYYICEYPLNVISCAEWKRQGYTSNGYYVIDPDGPGQGNDPYRIYCDMTSDGSTGITVFNHNQEMRQHVQGYESPLSYVRTLRYNDVTTAQVTALADIAGSCTQYISFECYGSTGSYGYTAWFTRNGDMADYWGGAPSSTSVCACGYYGNCDNGHSRCNCQVNDYNWRSDVGDLSDKNDLPVTQIKIGDTGNGDEQAYHTVGPLYCKSDESYVITGRTDYIMTDNGYISGLNEETISSTTVENCAAECAGRTSYTCRSFDFSKSSSTCYLSVETDETVALSSSSDFSFYRRKLPGQENPNRESNNCASGWAEYNSKCYFAGVSRKSWYDAELYCETQGGSLVTVDDEAEHEFLVRIGRWAMPSDEWFWIGINDIQNEGTWVNVDQSNATYNRWRSGEPNGGDIENGAIMSVYDNLDWLDYTVDSTYNFFCETNIGASAIAAPTTHSLCSSGWFHDDHSCYYFSTGTSNWDNARASCQSSNADLVMITKGREWDFLVNHRRYHFSNQRFWIGASDSASEGEFLWINEDSFSSTSLKWASGSPDDGDSNEDCVEFNEYQELNDETCTDGLYYICENDLYPVAVPANFAVETKSTSQIEVVWSPSILSDGQDTDVTGYRLYYWLINDMNNTIANMDFGADVYRYILSSLTPGTTYEFMIAAFSSQGEGPTTDPPLLATTKSSVIRTDTDRLKVYIIIKGQRLRQHAMTEFQIASLTQCTNICTSLETCVSVNFHSKSRDALKTCEINDETHTSMASDMEDDREYTYASVEGY